MFFAMKIFWIVQATFLFATVGTGRSIGKRLFINDVTQYLINICHPFSVQRSAEFFYRVGQKYTNWPKTPKKIFLYKKFEKYTILHTVC